MHMWFDAQLDQKFLDGIYWEGIAIQFRRLGTYCQDQSKAQVYSQFVHLKSPNHFGGPQDS